MTLPDPKFAPRRNDLPWLRRRRVKPAPAVAQAAPVKTAPPAPPTKAAPTTVPARPPVTPAAHTSGGKIDYTRRDRAPHAAPTPAPSPLRPATPPARPPASPPRPAPAAASSDNSLDLSAPTPPASTRPTLTTPAASSSLDLSGPPTPASTPPSGSGSDTSLDLDLGAPPPPTPRPPAASTSLDLGGGSPPPSPPASSSSTSLDLGGGGPEPAGRRRPPPPAAPDRHHVTRRTRRGATTLLDFGKPVVTLDRLQSGIGALTLDAVVGDEVGDLRIGAAWALTDGRTGTVELDANRRQGPNDHRPVVWAQREGRFERIAIDLRQSPSFARLLVYGFSPSRQVVHWGGTMVVTTYGGDRVEAPITSAPSPAVLALMTVYNVAGEFVVRAEMDPVAGSVRDTVKAFGYDRITWFDDRTPVG